MAVFVLDECTLNKHGSRKVLTNVNVIKIVKYQENMSMK